MKDERKQELMDQYDDAAFALMMDAYAEEEGSKLLKEYEEALAAGEVPQVPDSLDERCRKTIKQEFAKQHRKVSLKRFGQITAKAAAVALILIGVAATTIASVEALRVPFMNFWVEHFTDHSTIDFDSDAEAAKSYDDIFAQLLPSDYESVIFDESDGLVTLVCQNSEGHLISFDMTAATGKFNYDSEGAICEEYTLLTHRAFLLEEDGYQMIWIDEGKEIVYSLRATNIEKEDFVTLCLALAEALQ